MTRPFDKHLDSDELNALLSSRQEGEARTEIATESALAEAQRHADSCAECGRRVEMHRSVQSDMAGLETAKHAAGPSCLAEAEWLEVAAGLMSEDRAKELMSHAAQCGHCGPLLKSSMQSLSTEASQEEEVALANLKHASPDWQRKMALALRDAAQGKKTPGHVQSTWNDFFFSLRTTYATAALLIAFAGIWIGVRMLRQPTVEELLARAYTEQRTIEVRIPGAKYAPFRVERGATSSFAKSPSLLKAEARIRENLQKNPTLTAMLQAKVRAQMLDGDFDGAIDAARTVAEHDPESADAWSNLGAAFLARCREKKVALDCGYAYEHLSRALAKQPSDTTILFNRALAAESNKLFLQARTDWELFLSKETDAGWRAEAQEHLQQNEQKIQGLNRTTQGMPVNLEALASYLSTGIKGQVTDSSVEFDQKLAVEEWIPELAANPLMDGKRKDSLEKVLHLLGENLRLYHQDSWLADFVSQRPERFSAPAVLLLAQAISESKRGEQTRAAASAAESAKQFGRQGNWAGRLMSEFEEVYATRLGAHATGCYSSAQTLLRELEGRNYAWLMIQTQLEEAACANETSRPEEAKLRSEEALALARTANFQTLELRALVFVADSAANIDERMNALSSGLDRFWQDPRDKMRGYSFYATLDYETADELQLWNLNAGAIQESLQLLQNDPDLAMRSLEEFRYARALLVIGENDRARQTMAEARELQTHSSSSPLVTGAAIDLADAFVIKDRYTEALQLLGSVEPSITEISQDFVTEKFYATKGAALVAMGQNQEAEQNLTRALSIARKRLQSISNEEDRLEWGEELRPVYRSLTSLQMKSDMDGAFRSWESFKGLSLAVISHAAAQKEELSLWKAELPLFKGWNAEGTLLLSYAILPEGLAVWSYDGNVAHGRLLNAPPKEISALAHRFAAECSDTASDASTLRTEGRELYEALLKPVADWMKGKSNLIIELDADLQFVPFEALLDEGGRYVGDLVDVEYSPGLFYLGKERSPWKIERSSRLLAVGESEPDDLYELKALRGATEEAQEIAAFFNSPLLLLDSKATSRRVQSELSRAEIFHFAGHAIANSRVSGLVLSNSDERGSRILNARTLASRLPRTNRLVVFSACSTVNGLGTGLGDSKSLIRSALAAGVPVVVGSRWAADSDAARAWMKPFYESLLAGGQPNVAARRARFAVRKNPEWRHPYFWASFAVFV